MIMLINSREDHILGIIKLIGLLNKSADGYIPVTRGHGLISLSGHTGVCWTFVCDGLTPQEMYWSCGLIQHQLLVFDCLDSAGVARATIGIHVGTWTEFPFLS
jgi:hypothetical protein